MGSLRFLAAAVLVLTLAGVSPATAGPTGAVAIDRGAVGGEAWKLAAYAGDEGRCLDVLFRANPCRGCGSQVPQGAAVEFRRHRYLSDEEGNVYERPLTFVVIETSRRVETVKLNLVGRRPVSRPVRDAFTQRLRPPEGLRPNFRFAVVKLEGDALVRSAAAFDRRGRFVQRARG